MKQEDLPSLIKRVHDNAVKHGWHDQKRSEEHCLMMIVTEIAELVEADRKHRYAKPFVIGIYQSNQKIYTEFGECGEEQFQRFFEAYIKDTVQDELADVCIRIFDMFGELDYKPIPLICIETGERFPSFKDCSEKLGIPSSQISSAIKRHGTVHGYTLRKEVQNG